MEKLPQEFGPEKKFFINKKLSENFIDLSFIRNLGGFTKKCQKNGPKNFGKNFAISNFYGIKNFYR